MKGLISEKLHADWLGTRRGSMLGWWRGVRMKQMRLGGVFHIEFTTRLNFVLCYTYFQFICHIANGLKHRYSVNPVG